MKPAHRKYVLFGILGAVSIILDQWTKVMARASLRGHATKVVIDGFWKLRYSENTGVAFGMFQALPGGRILLTLVALVAFVMVIHYLRKTDDHHTRMHAALGLVGGGAIGNLIDRIAYGKVTDFIVWHVKEHEWPAFNVADAALVVGVGLMALDMLLTPKPTAAPAPARGKESR
jgi:signal peptidase II